MNIHRFISFYEEATNKMRFKKVLLVLFGKGHIQITFFQVGESLFWCSNQIWPESLDSRVEKSLQILYLVLTPRLLYSKVLFFTELWLRILETVKWSERDFQDVGQNFIFSSQSDADSIAFLIWFLSNHMLQSMGTQKSFTMESLANYPLANPPLIIKPKLISRMYMF